MHIYLWQIDPPPPIKHRCLAYCYTKLGTSHGRSIYIEQCTYTYVRLPPLQLSIDLYNPLHHISFPLLQSNMDALHTVTPNLANLMADL